jgi:hypothetical protein
MGEAKRRKATRAGIVYHHTSTLRTNLIWMSGVIALEGQGDAPFHPQLGEVAVAPTILRRAMKDFPAVAWFTTQISIPKCLRNYDMRFVDKETGETRGQLRVTDQLAGAISLHPVALGFPISDIGAVPWPQHYGYSTAEGRELNESARDVGDEPDDWYVCEQPVDVLKACEVWLSRTKSNPKLKRKDWYLTDVHRMVTQCRATRVYIPPSWLSENEARILLQAVAPHLPMQRGDGPPFA